MQLGMIGLGRMGMNMAVRLHRAGHEVIGCDPTPLARDATAKEGVAVVETPAALAEKLTDTPRVFWVMVPAGAITESVLRNLMEIARPGDIVIEGGNSNYKESQRRAGEMAAHGVHFLDCGTSGGVWGLANGYCLMVGGSDEAARQVEPIFRDLAQPEGYLHAGPSGAGHFAKMIHNGIEYGMLQAYAEGFEMLHAATEFQYDLEKLSHLWNHGSVVRSWLLELAERAFAEGGQEFHNISDDVADSGEGRWTVQESIDRAVPLPVIVLSLQMRFRSRQEESYAGQFIASLRNQFGGHAMVAKQKDAAPTEGPQPSGGAKDL